MDAFQILNDLYSSEVQGRFKFLFTCKLDFRACFRLSFKVYNFLRLVHLVFFFLGFVGPSLLIKVLSRDLCNYGW